MAYNYNNKNSSWGMIFILLIFFWPVGIFLLFQKMNQDKRVTFKSHKPLLLAGMAMTAVGLFFILGGVLNQQTSAGLIAFGAFIILGGILLISKAIKTKKRGERFRKYINIIANQHIMGIDNISSIMQIPAPTVINDLQKMIKLGYYKNAYVDLGTRQFVYIQEKKPDPFPSFNPGYAGTIVSTQPRVVSCPCCGANNTITGNSGACDYCGSVIS